MAYTKKKAWNFGPSYAGNLANAGYALDGATAWSAAAEVLDPVGAATGGVKATVTFPDAYAGLLIWCPDTTAVPKRYAFVEVNPGDDENTDIKVSTAGGGDPAIVAAAVWDLVAVNTTSYGAIIVAAGAILAGKVAESADHSSATISDINDPDTVRITAALTSTSRDVTIH